MSQKVVLKKIVKVKGSKVPRMYLYFTNPKGRRNLAPGADYEGYLILESGTATPYYLQDRKRIYLTEDEIKEMKSLFKRFPENQQVPRKVKRKFTFASLLFI